MTEKCGDPHCGNTDVELLALPCGVKVCFWCYWWFYFGGQLCPSNPKGCTTCHFDETLPSLAEEIYAGW